MLTRPGKNMGRGAAGESAPAIDGVVLDAIPDQKIFQRDIGQTSKAVSLSGQCGGFTATAIEAQVLKKADDSVVVDWTTIDAAPSGNRFAGAVTVPQGGDYYVKVRDSVHTDRSAALETSFFVGIVLIGYGQSNWLGHVTNSSGTPAANPGTKVFEPSNMTWGTTVTQAGNTFEAGNGARNMMNDLQSALGIPIGLVWGGKSGASLRELSKGYGTGYFENTLQAPLAAAGGDAEFIVYNQGEGDTTGTHTGAPAWQATLDTLHGDIVALTSRTKAQCPFVLASLATTESATTDADWEFVKQKQATIHAANPNMYYSHANQDMVRVDEYHYNAPSYANSGKRYAQTILKLLGEETHVPAWFVTGVARRSATVVRAALAHSMGTDFTPTSGITGFEVSGDNGGTWLEATAARVDATHIDLTHASIGTTIDVEVRYQYGMLPDISGIVEDNGPLSAPLNFLVPDTMTAPGSASLPVPTYVGGSQGLLTGSSTPQTKTVNLGVSSAAADTLVIMSLSNTGGTTFQTAALTPNGGAPIAGNIVGQTNNGNGMASFATFLVPAGTAGLNSCALSVTFSANPFSRANVAFWTVPAGDLNSQTPVDFKMANSASASSISVNLSTSEGGFWIACGLNWVLDNANAWSSSAETPARRYDLGTSGLQQSAADASNTANTTDTVTLTPAAAAKCAMAIVSFR